MPMIKRLHDKAGGKVKIWPFETGWRTLDATALDGVEAVFAEVWPSMLGTKPEAGEVKDEAQVRALAAHFAALDEQSKLASLFGPRKDSKIPTEIVETEEGWILGAQ
jgi:hypothetical protein